MTKTLSRLVLVTVLLVSTAASGRQNEGEGYTVAAIHVHLFYHATGEIDPTDLLDGRPHHLWNTVIGEGEAREPSTAVAVFIELAGPTFVDCPGRLAVKAQDGKKTLIDQIFPLEEWFNEGKRLVIPLFLYGTGCRPLDITARLQGLPAAKVRQGTLKRTVPFACGE